MPEVEQLLWLGCTVPACRCRKEMHVAKRSLSKGNHTHIRIYVVPHVIMKASYPLWGPCETGVPRTRMTLAKSPSNDGTTRAAQPSEAMIDARTLERKKRAN